MKTVKEYPATHSMSTSWYIVDDDGNVGILDYDENGPVPWGIEQTSGNELIYGHSEDNKHNTFINFNLTDEQVLDTLSNPHNPSEEKYWFCCVVEIDKEKTARFLELCKNSDIDEEDTRCVSENLGLYQFSAADCVHDKSNNKTRIYGTLKTMLQEQIILKVYDIQMLDMYDYSENEESFYVKEFDNSPYFIFHQPYWTDFLPQKMHEPKHPVHINQIPENFRHRLHKIPGKFREIDTFQIAQYYPCYTYGNGSDEPMYVVDGCSYQVLPLSNGSRAYMKVDMYQYPFFLFCSEKDRFHCTSKCCKQCAGIRDMLLTDHPTVLIVFDPEKGPDYRWKIVTDAVFQRAYATAYISKFPHKTKMSYRWSRHEIGKYMTQECLAKIFKGSKGYIETIVSDINPRVILVEESVYEIFKNNYSIKSHFIKINETLYPFYTLADLTKYRSVIEEFALQPYQGKNHPVVISIEEMKRLVEMGLAI